MPTRGVIDLGLGRVQRVLDALGNPERSLRHRVVHVGGTNGKGSVCAYIASALQAAGYRVGVFTTPHLVHERESIAVDGKPLTRPALDSALHEVQAAAASVGHGGSECGSLTSFEALTAAGFLTFSRSVDIAVMEVGVGGLHDATNVISDPAVCAITSVSLDHQDLLGDNIAEIARVKAGIFKSACPAVVGPVDPEAARAITEYAEHVGAGSLTWTRPATASDDRAGWASYRGLSFPLPLKGQFQFSNVAVALDVLHVLRSSSTVNCSDEQIIEGVRSVVWPGRLEWVPWPLSCHSLSSGPSHVASELSRTRVLVDGAHNLAAAVSLRNFIDFELADKKRKMLWPCRQPVAWIIAMSAGKDAAGILQALLRRGDSVFFVPFEPPKSMPWVRAMRAEELLSAAEAEGSELCQVVARPSLGAALPEAWADTQARGSIAVVCGSLYLVGQYLRLVSTK